MAQHSNSSFSKESTQLDEETLERLYRFLLPITTRWVYFSSLPSWRGQEYDLIQDIIQETIMRVQNYSQQSYVYFPERMSLVVAKHYYLDLKRKDHRLEHIISDALANDQSEYSEVAADNVFFEELFTLLAAEIMKFPRGQRVALLTDLARRMHFGSHATPLQEAFLQVEIDLKAYRLPIPLDPKARSRFASLLSYGYHRLLKLESVQRYIKDL